MDVYNEKKPSITSNGEKRRNDMNERERDSAWGNNRDMSLLMNNEALGNND